MALSAFKNASVRLPAEWEPHAGTWMAWPHEALTFPQLAAVEKVWVKMIRVLAKKEKVNLLAHSRLHDRFAKKLSRVKNLVVHDVAVADVWLRDTGPIFVKRSGRLQATCWEFNAWGNKYEELLADRGLNEKVAALANVPAVKTGMVLEGGSIDSNGAGLCLTSEQCLLNKNRNPALSKSQIEANLKKHLGFTQILWLGDGIAGDDTDGHVDDVARFVNGTTVVHAVAEKGDENFKALDDNRRRLQRYAKIHGLTLVEIPMPPRMEFDGKPMPASYCNFYIGDSVVLVPVFKTASDREALSILREHFSDRDVVGLDCRKVVEGMGAIHCVTQQQPL